MTKTYTITIKDSDSVCDGVKPYSGMILSGFEILGSESVFEGAYRGVIPDGTGESGIFLPEEIENVAEET